MVALRYESSRHVEKATSSGLFYVWLSAQLLSYSATQLRMLRYAGQWRWGIACGTVPGIWHAELGESRKLLIQRVPVLHRESR